MKITIAGAYIMAHIFILFPDCRAHNLEGNMEKMGNLNFDTVRLVKGYSVRVWQHHDSCIAIESDTINKITELEKDSWVVEIKRSTKRILYLNLKEVYVKPNMVINSGDLIGRLNQDRLDVVFLKEVVFSDEYGKVSYAY